MTEQAAEGARTCAGCSAPLHRDARGLNTCDTKGCGGNLTERFPIRNPPEQEGDR